MSWRELKNEKTTLMRIEGCLKAELPNWFWRMLDSVVNYKTSGWKATLMVIIGIVIGRSAFATTLTSRFLRIWLSSNFTNHAAKCISDRF